MKRFCIFWGLVLLVLVLEADIRLVQSDWYRGDGVAVSDSIWGRSFFRAESLNTENHMITFMSNEIEPTNWYSHRMYSGTETGSHYQFPVYGDIDGDEHLDFIGLEAQELIWYETDGNFDRWIRHSLHDFGGETSSGGNAKIYDMNLDGYNDIVVGVEAGMFIFYNIDGESFDMVAVDSTHYSYHELEIADMDLDGLPDIVTAGLASYGSTGPMFCFRQIAPDSFTASMIDSRSGHWRISIDDFNDDGYPDIFNSGWDVQCFINDGDMSFTQTFEMGIEFHASESFDGSGIADFDKDGDIDFLAVTSSDSGLYVIYNDGEGYIDSSRSYPEYPRSYADACIAGDVDLDGDYDVIGGNNNAGIGLSDGPEFEFWTIGEISNSHHVEAFNRDYECGVMMHVLSRSNDGYYLFENRMLSFPGGGFLESSVLDMAYGMYPRRFGWFDCIPDGFDVLYSYRYGMTVEACTTSEFIPIELSGDEVEGTCGGFFQYRIDFLRTTGSEDQSPKVDSVWLDVRQCGCFLDFDSMTFYQDTICDDSQNIEICYNIVPTCQDSSYNVQLLASSDGGDSWDVPLEAITDSSGALGDGIRRDWYCLRWNITEDLPDFSGEMQFRPIIAGDDIMAIVNTRNFDFHIDGKGPEAFARIMPITGRPLSTTTITIDSLRDRNTVIYEECYIRIEGCDIDDSLSLADISDGDIVHLEIPYTDCDSGRVIFHMVDSYCNHSEDTFYFNIENQPPEIRPCHTSLIGLFYGDTLQRVIGTIDESDSVGIEVFTIPTSEIDYNVDSLKWFASDTGFYNIFIIATDYLGLSDTCEMSVQVHSTSVSENIMRNDRPQLFVNPNPFQNKCYISLNNIPDSDAKIEVIDMLGQAVETMTIRFGAESIIWEPKGLVSGKYLLRLKAGDVKIDKEVILTR
ncbi:MAG: T9SS type A sorting domain-containing protein [Candidatus Zixiibacteriota bacterium]